MGDRGDEGGRTNEESSAPALAYVTPESAAVRGLPQDVDWLRRVARGWGILAAVWTAAAVWALLQYFHVHFDSRPIPRPRFETAVMCLLIGGELLGIWCVTASEVQGKRRWALAALLRFSALVVTAVDLVDQFWTGSRQTIGYARFDLVETAAVMAELLLLYGYLAAVALAADDRWLAVSAKVMGAVGAAGFAWTNGFPWAGQLAAQMGWYQAAISMMWRFYPGEGIATAAFVGFETAAAVLAVWAVVRVRAALPPMARTET